MRSGGRKKTSQSQVHAPIFGAPSSSQEDMLLTTSMKPSSVFSFFRSCQATCGSRLDEDEFIAFDYTMKNTEDPPTSLTSTTVPADQETEESTSPTSAGRAPNSSLATRPSTEELVSMVTSAVLAALNDSRTAADSVTTARGVADRRVSEASCLVSSTSVDLLTDTDGGGDVRVKQAASIIYRLVTEVSTDLTDDDRSRIRAKFGSAVPRSISGGSPRRRSESTRKSSSRQPRCASDYLIAVNEQLYTA
eukprot:Blabericola_migrator_1__3754@NODE_2125_length_3233_cov_243_118130_g1347_i0_p2_GENE_NODE_2125_length_3233_cov_243_118130_g1347_i0NODE_2125_length_3233_cov_243_118130_g1347_i0_p2_ORF_typecomplete_len249_score37_04_NODE_2125_length_3233_cov_243_118130_g1347_i015302276